MEIKGLIGQREEGYFIQKRTSAGEIRLTSEGYTLDKSDNFIVHLIDRLHDRKLYLTYSRDFLSRREFIKRYFDKTLHPYALNIQHRLIGVGNEGRVFAFPASVGSVAVKVYDQWNTNQELNGGYRQFSALQKARNNPYIQAPIPFMATDHVLVTEDFSKYPDLFQFVNENPSERERILKRLEDTITRLQYKPDERDIKLLFANGEHIPTEVKKCDILIKKFNPDAVNLQERYELAGVDIG